MGRWASSALRPGLWHGILVLTTLCVISAHAIAAEAPPACTPVVARIVSIEGSVEIRRSGQANWSAVTRLDTPLCQGDLLHAGVRSRAAVVILPEKFVRLDQNSTVSIDVSGDETIVEFFQDETSPKDACGAGYFITRFPRKFKVRTPFVNAAVEGTEFMVSMSCTVTAVAVFEGKVSADTLLANAQRFILNSGETVTAGPGEAPAVKVLVRPLDAVQWALYYPPLSEPGPGAGPDQLCDQSAPDEKGHCLLLRAEQRLRVGRVDEAQADIEASLKLVPDNSDADALLSVISVVKNDRQRALALAQHATQLDPVNPRAWIALSYAQQASFKLEDALDSAQRAAEVAPRSSVALTRVAELMMSLGRIRSAQRAAQAAVDANPNDSRAHTILGFVNLTNIDIKRARADFETAITLDSSDPTPRLGLGLAIIRRGNLTAGREQIEIAVALDPTNSLLRSYVGKAYYEENTRERDKLAATQYGLAKQFDPKDPTPWFYDAVLKQTQNRPVEALENIEKSIELNDNRAVYRSRLLLDEDLAARSANRAGVFTTLGFDELASTEAYASLDIDPTNFSGHRLLAEAYSTRPRYRTASVSELLQSQVWQPLDVTPIGPQLLDDQPFILKGAGPAGGRDLDPLFVANGANAYLSGLVGGNQTRGDQILVSGLYDRFSGSLGQMYYDTNGFQEGWGLRKNLYDGFIQAQLSRDTSFFVEARRSDSTQGDLSQNFFGQTTSLQLSQDRDLVRAGFRQGLAPGLSAVGTLTYQDGLDITQIPVGSELFRSNLYEVGTELQAVYRTSDFHLILGGAYYRGTGSTMFRGMSFDSKGTSGSTYAYTEWEPLQQRVRLSVGVSAERIDDPAFPEPISQVNPKFGITVTPWNGTTIRAAYFRILRRTLIAEQTIEPTEVAGFNQFYDDSLGTDAWRAAVAIDQRLSQTMYAGLELSKRRLTVPQPFTDPLESFDWSERDFRGYIYWAPYKWVAGTVAYTFEQLEDNPLFFQNFLNAQTQTVPIGLRFFTPSPQLSVGVTLTGVRQNGTFVLNNGFAEGSSQFWLTDLAASYFFPGRKGSITLEVRNLFDKRFLFQETDILTPTLARSRLLFLRVSLTL